MTALLNATGITQRFGGLVALNGVDLTLESGQIHGLIGPNGAGKSTLVNVLCGQLRPSAGSISLDRVEIGVASPARRNELGLARTFQNLRVFSTLTARENAEVAVRRRDQNGRHRSRAQAAAEALERVRLPADAWDRPAGDLPYMQQRLVEIARALATEPRVLLLDEPAAGANDEERVLLVETVRTIRRAGVALVVIEHDVPMIFDISDRITVLDHGVVIASGTPTEVRSDARVIAAYTGEPASIEDGRADRG